MSEPTKAEVFAAEQARKAAEQNLPPGAVPEQRPIASQVVDDSQESETYKKLRDSGELNQKASFEDYERAASKEQAKKAAASSQSESLIPGATVKITKGPNEGRVGVVLSVNYDGFEEEQKAKSGDQAVARFARVDTYIVRTRDGRTDTLEVKPGDVRTVAPTDFHRGEI